MKTNKQEAAGEQDFAALIGIDWADQKHGVCLVTCDSDKSEWSIVNHLPETLREWINGLRERLGGRPVASCLSG